MSVAEKISTHFSQKSISKAGCQIRRPDGQSSFQIILKVLSAVEIRAQPT